MQNKLRENNDHISDSSSNESEDERCTDSESEEIECPENFTEKSVTVEIDKNEEIEELYNIIPVGTSVTIQR